MAQNIIPSDAPSDLDVIESLSALEQKAIIRPNNPPPGIAGFLFDIDEEQWLELRSHITDHYTEANTAIQDNIALEPELFTVRGLVAELRLSAPLPQKTAAVTNPLPDNVPFTPPLTQGSTTSLLSSAGIGSLVKTLASPAALSILARKAPGVASVVLQYGQQIVEGAQGRVTAALTSAIKTLQDPANAAALLVQNVALPSSAQAALGVVQSVLPKLTGPIVDALKTPTFPNSQQLLGGAVAQQDASTGASNSLNDVYTAKQPTPPDKTRQTSAALYFYALWKGRQLFSVETPWGIFTNMAILSVRAEQPKDTKDRTDFTIVFKKIHIAQTVTVQMGQLAGRNAFQAGASAPTQNGNVGQAQVSPADKESILRSLFGPAGP